MAVRDHGNPFIDQNGNDPNLWRNVGTLAYYGVAYGYGGGIYAPNDYVSRAQTISFITRAMVVKGYWQRQPDDLSLFPEIPASSGHRIDISTYMHYVGSIPEANGTTQFPGWSDPATRGWFSEVLWRALNGYFGRDDEGFGGFVPKAHGHKQHQRNGAGGGDIPTARSILTTSPYNSRLS
ncbi:MAG: S-layer homology domain-containing protein [Chloroflexia bacterium]